MKNEFVSKADALRGMIGNVDRVVVTLKDNIAAGEMHIDNGDPREAVANVRLAHRSLEDARMRLGKAIQALEGGKSILDHPEVAALIKKIRATDA